MLTKGCSIMVGSWCDYCNLLIWSMVSRYEHAAVGGPRPRLIAASTRSGDFCWCLGLRRYSSTPLMWLDSSKCACLLSISTAYFSPKSLWPLCHNIVHALLNVYPAMYCILMSACDFMHFDIILSSLFRIFKKTLQTCNLEHAIAVMLSIDHWCSITWLDPLWAVTEKEVGTTFSSHPL